MGGSTLVPVASRGAADTLDAMQLADWLLPLLLLSSDDPHGRSPETVALDGVTG